MSGGATEGHVSAVELSGGSFQSGKNLLYYGCYAASSSASATLLRTGSRGEKRGSTIQSQFQAVPARWCRIRFWTDQRRGAGRRTVRGTPVASALFVVIARVGRSSG